MRPIRHASVFVAGIAAAILLGMAPPVAAQGANAPVADGFQPRIKPTLEIRKAAGRIEVDGKLEEAGWRGAARATGFTEYNPKEGVKPPVESEVWVTYDEENLYLAFIAKDQPGTIRASLTDRDRMWSDDYFGILLDTYGDASWAYFIFANPRGVQGDTRFATASGEDDSFDIIYSSEASITADGYVIEMAIPFSSLRFPDRPTQTWRATFWRTRPRASREQHSWAAISRNDPCFLCQYGTLTGIEGVKPGGRLELLPTVVASQSGSRTTPSDPTSAFKNGSVDADASLGLRYSFPSGLTAEATINPDFSQVESDVAQVDVNTTFALFFPERRPFFQEGSDLFSSNVTAVYTRSINDPQMAVKLIKRQGRTTIAYLGARDAHSPLLLPFEERSFTGVAGKSLSNIARVRRTFGRESWIGALVTDRRLEDGGSGTLAGIDGVFRFGEHYRLEYNLVGSRTVEPDDPSLTPGLAGVTFDRGGHTAVFDGESFSGYAQYTSFERDARTWSFDFDYWAYSPTFRAANGFESRNDYRRVSMYQDLTFRPKTGFITRINPNVYVQSAWNFDGVRKAQSAEGRISADLKGQTFASIRYFVGRERFRDIEFDGIHRWSAVLESNFSRALTLGGFIGHGESIARNRNPAILGTGTDIELWATLRPTGQLSISPSFVYSELNEPNGGPELFNGYILRTRADLQFTREFFLRLVVQYNDFGKSLDVEPLLTYKVNPFTLFYVGSTYAFQDYDQPDTGLTSVQRQYFAKIQYQIRR